VARSSIAYDEPVVYLSRLTGLVLIAAIGGIPLAPPEHVHESHDPGHHGAVAHRHVEAHGGFHHVANHDGVFDDDDAQVLTLSYVFVIPPAPAVISAPTVQAVVTLEPPVIRTLQPPADYVELVIHGPPRAPASFRAPPSFLAL
jgi:hypothetical protein